MRRRSLTFAGLFLIAIGHVGCAERSGVSAALPQRAHRMSVEVELKAYLDRDLLYVQWEGWRWRDLDGQAVDPTLALRTRHKVSGVDTAIVQMYASDGESLATVSEEVALLRKAMLTAASPPDRLVVYVLSGDFRRKVADVIRDFSDGEPAGAARNGSTGG